MLSDFIKSEGGVNRRQYPSFVLPTICVDRDPKSDLLVERRGRPVWPIRDEDDWRSVSRLCQLRSIEIQEVQGKLGEIKRRKSFVTGLGCARIQEVARLYAHLTARRFQKADDVSALRDLFSSAVIVTTFEHLSSSLLHALYSDPGAQLAAGLICAADIEDLRRQVLVRSILPRARLLDE